METPKDVEVVRAAPQAVRAVEQPDDAGTLMEVRFTTFGEWYEINSIFEGRFLERVDQGTFTRAMNAEMDAKKDRGHHGIRVQFDHGFDQQIGGKSLGTIVDMREDADGAVAVVRLFDDTSYVRDLLPGLQAGAYGSSMRMVVTRDEWADAPGRSDHNPDGIPERTLKEARLPELGPVVWPANPGASVGLRSLTDNYYERAGAPARDAALAAREACTPLDRPGSDATRDDGPADEGNAPPDPAPGHSGGLTPAQRREALHPQLTKESAS